MFRAACVFVCDVLKLNFVHLGQRYSPSFYLFGVFLIYS